MSQLKVRRHAFTLIELLVVIAIIALLAAILFPVFAKAREKARQTACLSNEKQIALGLMQYNSDYDEQFPCGLAYTGSQVVGWAGPIYSYVKSTDVFHCPDDPTPIDTSVSPPRVPVSYAVNTNLIGKQLQPLAVSSVPVAVLSAPASTVLAFEVHGVRAQITTVDEPTTSMNNYHSGVGNGLSFFYQTGQTVRGLQAETGNNPTITYATGHFPGRSYGTGSPNTGDPDAKELDTAVHSDGSNFIAADGHAKWSTPGQVSSGGWAASANNAQDETCPLSGTLPCASGTTRMSMLTGNTKFTLTFSPW